MDEKMFGFGKEKEFGRRNYLGRTSEGVIRREVLFEDMKLKPKLQEIEIKMPESLKEVEVRMKEMRISNHTFLT